MSRLIFRILVLLCLLNYFQPIVAQDAKILAYDFFSSRGISQHNLETVYLEGEQIEVYENSESHCFVAFGKYKNGYSLLGYSLENVFSGSENADSIGRALLHDLQPPGKWKSFQFDSQWPEYVEPLLTTQWSQGSFFNRNCPVDLDVWHGRAWAGCVAVAVGQIVKHYGDDNSFVIDESYDARAYGYLTAWADGYNWASLLDDPLSYDLEVSKLLSDIGILVHTCYGTQGSSATTGRALKGFNELGYPDAYRVFQRDYSHEDWMELVYSNLAEYNPIFVAGGGHAFVCDGYDENGFLHFNLGGGGIGNGYYSTAVIHGYTVQEAIVGITPDISAKPPRKLDYKNDEQKPFLTWSHPDENQDYSYRIYLDSTLVAETTDTLFWLDNQVAGHFFAYVSAVKEGIVSKRIGPINVRIVGSDLTINDPEISRAMQVIIGIWGFRDELNINEADLDEFKELEILNPITNTEFLEGMRNLQSLRLNCQGLIAEDLLFISNLSKLQSLYFTNVNLESLPDFKSLKKLVKITIEGGYGSGVDLLSTTPNLMNLEIIETPDIQEFQFENLKLLEELKIEDSDLSGLDFISAFPMLRRLIFSHTKLSSFHPLIEHRFLQDLQLDNNLISDLDWLHYFPNLVRLTIRNNKITSLLLNSKLDLLYTIDLHGNEISDIRLPFDFPKLHDINLSENQLTSLPGQLLTLKALKNLNLSYNKIEFIPLMASQYLKELNLEHNRLTFVPDFSNFIRMNKLDLSDNQFSDLFPLVSGGAASQFSYLDVSNNPISVESFENHIENLEKGVTVFHYPDKPQLLAACFPGSGNDAIISTNSLELTWEIGNAIIPLDYEVLIGEIDSLGFAYSSHIQRSVEAQFQKGQVYHWQVKTVLPDTCFYSGIYKIRTMEALELPFFDDFEDYPNLSDLTATSTIWRMSNSGGETYRDARIVSGISSYDSKVLFVNSNTDITIDLDHLDELVLKISFKLKILNRKSAHIVFSNMNGLKMEISYFDGMAELLLNGSLVEIFDYPQDEWVDYELSILGKNNRIFFRRNQELVFNTQWEFHDGVAHIDKIVLCPDELGLSQNNAPSNYYFDDLLIKTIGSSTIDDIELDEQVETTIFPNPASNFINIKGLPGGISAGEVKLIRMDGSEVYHEYFPPGTTDARIDIQTLPTGLYVCQILYPGRRPVNNKILIQPKTL